MPVAKQKVLVVEVEKGAPIPEMSEELSAQILTLQHHPGFLYLLRKLDLQRQLLRSELETKRQATVQDSEFIKSGIAWCGWLNDQLRQVTGFSKRQTPPREALDAEMEAFRLAQSQLELVG